MPSIYIRTNFPADMRQKWRSCYLCEANPYKQVELRFDSGSVEPQTDEVLTGATSGNTGIVVEAVLESGTWAGGDAVGTVIMSSPTGVDSDGNCFEDDEEVNGSVGGDAILTANLAGIAKTYGLLYPESYLIFEDGRYWCKPHHDFHFRIKHLREQHYDFASAEEALRKD